MKFLTRALRIVAVVLFMLVLFPPQAQAEKGGAAAAAPTNPVTSLFNVRIGGYVQTNVTWDTDENNNDNPSSLRKISVVKGTPQEHRETLRWAATRTRTFFDIRGPEMWGGAKSRGYIEFDWDGLKLQESTGTSSASSAQTPRLRHAYARFDWPVAYLTVGQTTLIFNGVVSSQSQVEGVSSGHGDITAGSRNRTPQFILGAVIPAGPVKVEVAGAVGRNQTDRQAAAGLNDSGSRSGLPSLQALVKLSTPLFGRDLIVSGSNYWGRETFVGTAPLRNFAKVDNTGYAVELFMPLPTFAGFAPDVRGAWFTADNMDRWNLGLNGLTTQNPAQRPRAISATGGWIEANLAFLRHFAVGAGWGNVEDDRDRVRRVIQSTPRVLPQNNTGRWLFAQWNSGPVLVEFLFGRIDTTFVRTNQQTDAGRREDTHSNAYHLLFRYRF